MPSAYPYQQGLIGLYNNSHGNPGIYVSWDPDTNFSSTQSLIFKGAANTDYRFPVIINRYTDSGINFPIGQVAAAACGSKYYYVVTDSRFVVYQKISDYLSTVYHDSISSFAGVPDTLLVRSYNNTDYIFFPIGEYGTVDIYTFDGSTLNSITTLNYDDITGLSGADYNGSYLTVDENNFYLTYGGAVYACAFTTAFNLYTSNRGIIIDSTNGIISGNTLSFITNYDNAKIAVCDNQNFIYEFAYEGDINLGNTSTQWSLNFKLTPTQQTWSCLLYNHFGIIIATDSTANTVNVIASSLVTINTQYYGFNGVTYSVQSTTSTTQIEGRITNTVGSTGVEYQQFNSPTCIAEDFEFNILIGDKNNRLTYIPTQLDFVASVQAPLNEFIDSNGNPADIYYIKQTNEEYSAILSIPPILGDELLIKSSVLFELNALLKVPVYDEEPLYGYNRTSAQIAYGDLVTDPAPQVRITCSTNNGQRSSMFVLSPYTAFYNSLDQSNSDPFSTPDLANNYPNGLFYRFTNEGRIFFFDMYGDPVSIQEYDTVLISYYVKMFTNTQINNALYLSLQMINAQPGTNKIYSPASVPFYYDAVLVVGATYYLLRQLLVGLNQRERRLLVMDPESGTFDAVANLRDTAKMYQEEFNEGLKKLPIAIRPVMGTISVPEYAFPGGRSRLFRAIWKNGAS